MPDYRKQRERMVEVQISRRGVCDERVLTAMREVPRERFVSQALAEFAYEDSPLPIDEGQTISQPYIVALMIEAADSQAGLPRQLDAYVWFDDTEAVTPLGPEHRRAGVPDTYPFGE